MEDELQVDVVYIDFSKAFDRVMIVVVGHVDSKILSSDDFLGGFLFDWSYTTRSAWQ
jgi:hypothetical protein